MLVEGTKIKWSYNNNSTTCTIENDQEVIISKTVKKFEKDIANKRLGRKIAFEGAMKLISQGELLSKQIRSNIWNAFRTRINQPVLNQ